MDRHGKSIRNIIFDLGGVIINLDIQATIRSFNGISAVLLLNRNI